MTEEQLQIDDKALSDLCARIKQFLALQHFPSFRQLEVTMSDDTVILDGRVPSFHERQMAVVFCQRVAGVHNVVDRLLVSAGSAVGRPADCSHPRPTQATNGTVGWGLRSSGDRRIRLWERRSADSERGRSHGSVEQMASFRWV
jgi:hypothetical protein